MTILRQWWPTLLGALGVVALAVTFVATLGVPAGYRGVTSFGMTSYSDQYAAWSLESPLPWELAVTVIAILIGIGIGIGIGLGRSGAARPARATRAVPLIVLGGVGVILAGITAWALIRSGPEPEIITGYSAAGIPSSVAGAGLGSSLDSTAAVALILVGILVSVSLIVAVITRIVLVRVGSGSEKVA